MKYKFCDLITNERAFHLMFNTATNEPQRKIILNEYIRIELS